MKARHRLRNSRQFLLITRTGVRSARTHVVAHLASIGGADETPRVGFVVSKKVGNSVVRHRVTRRLRELVNAQIPLLPPGSGVVLRSLPGIAETTPAELAQEVNGALARAREKHAQKQARQNAAADG
ncbi:ribonuclease P protein component [Dermabacteraceae bacterium P7074]